MGNEFCLLNNLMRPMMKTRRAEPITHYLLNHTVLNDWFGPMQRALNKVRFSDAVFHSLPMESFLLLGGLRQLLSLTTLREQVQSLFHLDSTSKQIPVARSTWSDAMSSTQRRDILRHACAQLITTARDTLPDRFDNIEGIGKRPILAIDVTYQTESSHYCRVLPTEGGCDNQKGHLLLTYYDLRLGTPVDVRTQTQSMGEMRVLKARDKSSTDWSRIPQAIYVVDRAFIDGRYWDERKQSIKATVITRLKSKLVYTTEEVREVAALPCNDSVVSDTVIHLNCSQQPWRLIQWRSPEGAIYQYITNDFTLEPGVVAFLYYRRWDCEKYFDNFKNDLAGAKAWGKSPIAIEQQAIMGLVTYVLTRLFVNRYGEALGIQEKTQSRKHAKKQDHYLGQDERRQCVSDSSDSDDHIDEESQDPVLFYDAYRAFWTGLSKITKQVWRFLKSCFYQKSSTGLYERQLRPILEGYL